MSGADISGRTLALVPARSGSKGIPGKNLSLLGSRSLVEWAVALAQATPEIDHCMVSTDGEDIAAVARQAGAEVHPRKRDLARDDSAVLATIRDVITDPKVRGHYRFLVLLEPTSPFRKPSDVTACLRGLANGADSAATFTEACLHPHRAFTIEGGQPRPFSDGAVPWSPRQSLVPRAFQLSGSVYAFRIESLADSDSNSVLFGRIHAVLVPRERALDIDDPHDLELANALYAIHGEALTF